MSAILNCPVQTVERVKKLNQTMASLPLLQSPQNAMSAGPCSPEYVFRRCRLQICCCLILWTSLGHAETMSDAKWKGNHLWMFREKEVQALPELIRNLASSCRASTRVNSQASRKGGEGPCCCCPDVVVTCSCASVVFGGNRCIPDDEREMYVEVEDNIAAVAVA